MLATVAGEPSSSSVRTIRNGILTIHRQFCIECRERRNSFGRYFCSAREWR